ncbi:MAG: SbcC/MukB-like Walker B domain-containing protein [Planctomycetota bacterium]
MYDLFESIDPVVEAAPITRPGFRLARLEVFNWGTFDSQRNEVHVVPINGESALLIGQNGSGKSTLVDALLTLLVKPGNTRNYNLAAGAGKGERNERTYLKGAYDRRSQEETHKGDVQFLRKGHFYSVLLACFRNEVTGKAFTLAQVLYLGGDGHSVEKLYCFAPDERSIAAHCSGLKSMEKLAQQMQKRGFTRTSRSYTDYFEWFRKVTGVQPQAMDLLNQTVAMKDIGLLNEFIRKHMLQPQAWGERVDNLLNHFRDLNDTHRDLLRIRNQLELLEPLEETGTAYRECSAQLARAERMHAAVDVYFHQQVIDLFTPACDVRRDELRTMQDEKQRLTDAIKAEQQECRSIQNAIDQEASPRLQLIPTLIDKHRAQAAHKREKQQRYQQSLVAAGLSEQVADAAGFQRAATQWPGLATEVGQLLANAQSQRDAMIDERGTVSRTRREEEEELAVLRQRQGNLPASLTEIRRRMCEDLNLKEDELRFAAELMMVNPDERAWEASIELALGGFARTLLVPQQHYKNVSRYIDQTRMQDVHGKGQRVTYRRVSDRTEAPSSRPPGPQSLSNKLVFREGHLLTPWVRGELLQSFNFLCCDTIEEFQQAPDKALTRNRQVKYGSGRHEKDDREQAADPRYFVLGWDNKEKKRRLEAAVKELRQRMERLDRDISKLDQQLEQNRARLQAINEAQSISDFSAIDFQADEDEILKLQKEEKGLREGSPKLRLYQKRLEEHEQKQAALEISRDQSIRSIDQRERWLVDANKLIDNCRRGLKASRGDGSWPRHSESFPDLEALFEKQPLTTDDWSERRDTVRKSLDSERSRRHAELTPIEETLLGQMTRFLIAKREERHDLQAGVVYLDDFLRLLEHIRLEDLPRHEKRFKERLNEKVGDDVNVLRSSFEIDRAEIKERIDLLNHSLQNLEYDHGTHMRLEVKEVRDPEIRDFRQKLDACVNNQLDSSPESLEARFERIQTLIQDLGNPDDDRWRRKVIDVRNWFDFAAVEINAETGEEHSYHEDSSGQSGGEKAKLAFTILVAAIAYQYDLDPSHPERDRFHFVVVDEMFSRIDDRYSQYALQLFQRFGLQLLIVAPLDAKARVTEPYVDCYLLVSKDSQTHQSEVVPMTVREFQEAFTPSVPASADPAIRPKPR